MKRDDVNCKRLFLQSKSENFDISNLWKLYFEGDKQGSINLKSDRKLVRDLGNFGVPVGNAQQDSKKHQTILSTGRGKVIKKNSLPVYLQG